MARRRFSPEQIIIMLLEAEVLLNQYNSVPGACRKLGILKHWPAGIQLVCNVGS